MAVTKNKIGYFLVLIGLLFVSIYPGSFNREEHYREQTTCGFILCVFIISYLISQRCHWSVALGFLLSASTSCYLMFTPYSPYLYYGIYNQPPFIAIFGQSFVWLMLTTITILFSSIEFLDFLRMFFGWLCFISSVMLLMSFKYQFNHVGIIDNLALDSTFIALVLPSMFNIKNKYILTVYVLIPIAAILLSKSNTSLAMLGCEATLYCLLKYRKPLQAFTGVALISAITLAYGYWYFPNKFLQSSGRFPIWKMAIEQWRTNGSLFTGLHNWIGTGSGSYSILGPLDQKAHGYNFYFQWAHNEYIQILYEQGWVGLTICFIILYFMIRKTVFKNNFLFITVLSMMIGMFSQGVFRVYPMCLYSALICRLCFVLRV